MDTESRYLVSALHDPETGLVRALVMRARRLTMEDPCPCCHALPREAIRTSAVKFAALWKALQIPASVKISAHKRPDRDDIRWRSDARRADWTLPGSLFRHLTAPVTFAGHQDSGDGESTHQTEVKAERLK